MVAVISAHDRLVAILLDKLDPIVGHSLAQIADLKHHAQAQFAKLGMVSRDVIEDFALLLVGERIIPQHVSTLNHILNMDRALASSINTNVHVVAAANDSLEMISKALAANLIKLHVGDEDDPTLVFKLVGDVVLLEIVATAVPADVAHLLAIQRSLEDVQGVLIVEDAVAVVEHQDLALFLVFPKLLVELGRGHRTAHHLIHAAETVEPTQHAQRAHQRALNGMALANASRTTHNQPTDDVHRHCISHLTEDVERFSKFGADLSISAIIDSGNSRVMLRDATNGSLLISRSKARFVLDVDAVTTEAQLAVTVTLDGNVKPILVTLGLIEQLQRDVLHMDTTAGATLADMNETVNHLLALRCVVRLCP